MPTRNTQTNNRDLIINKLSTKLQQVQSTQAFRSGFQEAVSEALTIATAINNIKSLASEVQS